MKIRTPSFSEGSVFPTEAERVAPGVARFSFSLRFSLFPPLLFSLAGVILPERFHRLIEGLGLFP